MPRGAAFKKGSLWNLNHDVDFRRVEQCLADRKSHWNRVDHEVSLRHHLIGNQSAPADADAQGNLQNASGHRDLPRAGAAVATLDR
jgi:hypothetical protein